MEDFEDDLEDGFYMECPCSRNLPKENFIRDAGKDGAGVFMNFCDWCSEFYLIEVPFHVVHLRGSQGDENHWVCQLCIDSHTAATITRYEAYKKEIACALARKERPGPPTKPKKKKPKKKPKKYGSA